MMNNLLVLTTYQQLMLISDNAAKSGMTLPAGGSAARRRAPDQICRRPALFCLEGDLMPFSSSTHGEGSALYARKLPAFTDRSR